MRATIFTIVFVALIAIGIWIERNLWIECRTDHNVLYCLRVLGN